MHGLVVVVAAMLLTGANVAQDGGDPLARRLLDHIGTTGVDPAIVAKIRNLWERDYRATPNSGFFVESLAILSPDFSAALRMYDSHDLVAATERFAALRADHDPFVAANAAYFHVRVLVERGLVEEAEEELDALTADDNRIGPYTPFEAHLLYLRGFAQAANLRFSESQQTLARLQASFPAAAESVRVGATQLSLELARREVGTLDEASALMGYVANRLGVLDRDERVEKRQDETIELLDKLVKDAQQREDQQKKQKQSGRGGGKGGKGPPRQQPSDARDVSEAPAGAGEVGSLHGVEKADPGAAWGKLPPAERERVLQSLRSRFPSRYRELVEQYYRSLAEEK